MADKLTRIAIVNGDRCRPKKCRQECKKSCPVVRMGKQSRTTLDLCIINVTCGISWVGKLCIEVTPADKIATISETLCIGCGICVKVRQCLV